MGHVSVHAARRARLLERAGRGAVFVLSATPVATRNNDVDHDYRQDSDLYYLTGFDEPETVLVLTTEHDPGKSPTGDAEHRCILFVRPRDPEREIWDGARAGVDGAVRDFGADAAFPIGELASKLPEYLKDHDRLVYRMGRDRGFDDKVLRAIDGARSQGRHGSTWPLAIVDPATLVHEMRLFKAEDELAIMRKAASITAEAHVGAMKLAKPGRYEYEVEALLSEVFRRSGCERAAYGSIVGSGANATVLHYRKNDKRIEAGELLLIDAGCEYGYYASDVTRTFPVSGRFSTEQHAIYDVVLAAQEAGIEAVRPGATLDDVHKRCVEVIVDGLIGLGLLAGPRAKAIEEQSYRRFFMHKTSHWLGMDVHDVGIYHRAKKPRPLEPGMVLTVEPGIYIAVGDDSVPPAYRGIGVRIEDDIAVTTTGYENLTLAIPKSVAELERACAA